MHLSELLQQVLSSYVEKHKTILSGLESPPRIVKISFVCERLGVSGATPQFIADTLLEYGYIERNIATAYGEPYQITTSGNLFYSNGGFKKAQHLKQIEEDIKIETLSKLKFEKKVFWLPIIISSLAFLVASLSLWLNYKNSRADISITNDKLMSTEFKDRDGKKKFFGLYRAILSNNGNRSVTLLGLKPHELSGLLLTTLYNSNAATKTNVDFKIFRIPDQIPADSVLNNDQIIQEFENEGLDKLSMMNKVILPGEIYLLNIGVVFDLFSDSTKKYSSMIFTTELHFSNGQKLNFGAGGNLEVE